ncbi:MAG: dihydrofolate synthase [Candidatus Hydrogenedentota bacterium]
MTAREYLAGLEFHGIKLGLENIHRLAAAAGNPHLSCPTIHVAGTNGKGSVLAFLGAIIREAGYCEGRFTSPHLIDVNERFLVGGSPITDEVLDEQISFFRTIAESMPQPPTYFELCTAVAFRWFALRRVDLALFEVGMGGRFDSTNIIHPLACAITNISLEHTKYLGNSIAEIAFEKAGIIKPGVPVVVTERQPAALDVIRRRASELRAPVLLPDRDFSYQAVGGPLRFSLTYRGTRFQIDAAPLGLAGQFQSHNASVAIALAELLAGRFPKITRDAVCRGLAAAKWPCRLEKVLDEPPVYLDVAHNPAGMAELAGVFRSCVVVLSVSSDKAAAQMVDAIAPVAKELILTQFAGPRALPVDQLAAVARHVPHRTFAHLDDAIRAAISVANPACPALITGSIFAAGQARQILACEFGARSLTF